jgi:hypothetical protein
MANQQENNEHNYLGYLYHYPNFNKPTPFQLDICLTEKPTEKHYDPKNVSVSVVSDDQENIIEQMKIVHPMSSSKDRRFCPGVVRMVDRKDKVEEALIFGGNLSIQSEETATFLIFTSTAPIIKITNTTKMDEMFRDEIEILWAERRAYWLSQPEEFDRRLVSVDPLVLYRASLNALIEKYENLRHYDPQGIDVMHYLQTRITRLNKAGFKMVPEPQIKDIL